MKRFSSLHILKDFSIKYSNGTATTSDFVQYKIWDLSIFLLHFHAQLEFYTFKVSTPSTKQKKIKLDIFG